MKRKHHARCIARCFMHPDLDGFAISHADGADGKCALPAWVKDTSHVILQTVLRPVQAKGLVVLPKRWPVERTFAWLGRRRRFSKDHERLKENSEAAIDIAMIDIILKQLVRTCSAFSNTFSHHGRPG